MMYPRGQHHSNDSLNILQPSCVVDQNCGSWMPPNSTFCKGETEAQEGDRPF